MNRGRAKRAGAREIPIEPILAFLPGLAAGIGWTLYLYLVHDRRQLGA